MLLISIRSVKLWDFSGLGPDFACKLNSEKALYHGCFTTQPS